MDKVKDRLTGFIPYVVIAFLSTGILLRVMAANGDELWNYNFARCVCNGLRPYSDFSMVQTPLSAYLGGLILMVFGDYYVVYRLAGVVLMIVAFSLMYKISVRLIRSKSIAFATVIFSLMLAHSTWIYNYNTINLVIIFIIIRIRIGDSEEKDDKDLKRDIVVGLLQGLTPLLKQTTGLMLMIANVFLAFVDYKKYGKKLRNVVVRVLVSGVPCLFYIVYLLVSGQLADFIDYTVVGVSTFNHRYTIVRLMSQSFYNAILVLGVLLLIIYTLWRFLKMKEGRKKRMALHVLVFSIAGSIVAYPLSDLSHFILAALPFVLCFYCCIDELKLNDKELIVCNTFMGFLILFCIPLLFPSLEDCKMCELKHYELIPIYEAMEDNIKAVDEFISENEKKGINVLMTSPGACIYMIPLDMYNKNYDMLLLGNLGSATVEDLLNVEPNTIFLMLKDNSNLNEQSHFELVEYILKNYECVGEIRSYDVYRATEK